MFTLHGSYRYTDGIEEAQAGVCDRGHPRGRSPAAAVGARAAGHAYASRFWLVSGAYAYCFWPVTGACAYSFWLVTGACAYSFWLVTGACAYCFWPAATSG